MRSLYCFLLVLVCSPVVFATHFLGGHIQATPLAGQAYTYRITLNLYYNVAAGREATRDATELNLCFGDGTMQSVSRTRELPWVVDPTGVSISQYTITHTYNGPGVYTLQSTGNNRTSMRNFSGTEITFSLKTTLQVVANATNATPVLSLPNTGVQLPINQRVVLNLGAVDQDGDSLSYALAYPLTNVNSETISQCMILKPVNTYQFPNDVRQVGTYRINAKTGLLTWDVPVEQGQYAVAIIVSEWRNGVNISDTEQELTLTVIDKGGTPVTPPLYEPAVAGFLTAIDDNAPDDLQLTVSPNPSSSGLVQVSLQNRLGAPVIFSVMDNQGRIQQRIDKSQPIDQQQFQIDLGAQPAGLYFIRAESGGRQVTRKVLRE